MSDKRPEFLPYVHSFRAVAITFVVATHALYDLNWFEKERIWAKIAVSVVQNGTVPFVFIAGFLFQHLMARFRYTTYLATKLRFVILPYVLVSLPYVIMQKRGHFGIFANWFPQHFETELFHVAFTYLSGDQMPIPLWFIPMIAVYYLLAPVFVFIDRHPRLYLLLPPLVVLACFAHRPQHQTVLTQSLVYFLPVYLAGMFTSHHRERLLDFARRFRWPLVVGMVGCVVLEVLLRERTGAIESAKMFSTERGIFDVNLPMKLVGSVVVLDLLRRAHPKVHQLLDKPAEMSFGIFFVHYYFIVFARELRVELGGAPWAGSLWNLFSYTLALMLLSMALVWLVQLVFGKRSRYLVGC